LLGPQEEKIIEKIMRMGKTSFISIFLN